ncbi:DUF4956 domain-containing protein [Polaribacter gangjinensis]|uniref:DUF4956 domain-containing protein n=1 Tax=Polaribacter gangjinensis TaxID=574710 RepID=A0A2S7WDN2_9FLAO|nr:DUF4956 domain-containing protein [Polaribacter gangjinensis]PQJ75729.1 DUF4956 domain-containing protein [Polaribacter gangjinensis]
MDLLNFPIFDQDFYSMALLFFLNLFFITIIIRWFYYGSTGRKDYLFTFFMISIVLFFISFTLKKFNLNIGLAIGLFAVFGIIRYRTESIPIREMTYLFIVIGISLMNAVVNSKLSYTEILFSNVAITWAVGFIEKVWHVKHEITKKIIYEKIENIKSENYEFLIADLEERTGIPINKVTIDDIDFVKDCATLTIYYNLQPEKRKK